MPKNTNLENIAEVFYNIRKINKHILITINGAFLVDDNWDFNMKINLDDDIQIEYRIPNLLSSKSVVFRFKMKEIIGYAENKYGTILYIESDITINIQRSDTLPLLIEKISSK
ncbi:MAG: hypothetical protein QG603_392 [Patescibacteria group bacterium]|nr:hypothetical protein [Patescibacteria group bacterium]MDQ5970615.1 hypothetical protein [Patescibacteria group bacterium]